MSKYWVSDIATEDAKRVVERYLDEVLNGNKPESAPELISDGRLIRAVERFRAAWPDLVVEPRVLLAGKELVSVYLEASGTHLGDWFGKAPTGKKWSAGCVAMYAVRDGKIADFWISWDELDMYVQLGFVKDPHPE